MLNIPFENPPPIQPETIFSIGGLAMTNAMFLGVLVTLFFTLFSILVTRKLKIKPGKIQLFCEWTVLAFLDLLEKIAGSRKNAEDLLPLVGTLFLFFGVSNLIGLVPGMTSITYGGIPMLRTPTNDFNMTFSIAFAMVALANYASFRAFGLFGHLGKFIKIKGIYTGFKQSFGKGMLGIVDFVLGLLDIVSEIAKIFSLSLRLFGNMYAGEVMAAVLLGAFAVALPTIWLGFNAFVAVLQAMVFGALTAAYYSLAVTKMEEE